MIIFEIVVIRKLLYHSSVTFVIWPCFLCDGGGPWWCRRRCGDHLYTWDRGKKEEKEGLLKIAFCVGVVVGDKKNGRRNGNGGGVREAAAAVAATTVREFFLFLIIFKIN